MDKPPSPRPLSIKVIAITSVLIAMVDALSFFPLGKHFVAVFWFQLPGWLADVYWIAETLLVLYIGTGLWRLSALARKVGIAYVSLLLLHGFLNLPAIWLIEPWAGHLHWTTILLMGPTPPQVILLLLFGVSLWFLIKRKSAFVKPRQSV